MKYAEPRPLADPEKAARKLPEIANAIEAVQDGRIYISAALAPTCNVAPISRWTKLSDWSDVHQRDTSMITEPPLPLDRVSVIDAYG